MRHDGPESLGNPKNVPAYGTFGYTQVTRLSTFTADHMIVTSVLQDRYAAYRLPSEDAYQTLAIDNFYTI